MVEDPEYTHPGKGRLKAPDEEIGNLKRENERLIRERDILKKAVAIFIKRPGSIFTLIAEYRSEYGVERCAKYYQCLGVDFTVFEKTERLWKNSFLHNNSKLWFICHENSSNFTLNLSPNLCSDIGDT
jgi:hypothetical protein